MAKKPKRGNPVAQAAIMRKGGVHEKSKSAKRQHSKRKLRNEVNQYLAANREIDDLSDFSTSSINKRLKHFLSLFSFYRLAIR